MLSQKIVIIIIIVVTVAAISYFAYKRIIQIESEYANVNSKLSDLSNKLQVYNFNDTAQITKLANDVQQALTKLNGGNIVGSIVAYAGTNIPQNYMICDGNELLISEYSDLFVAIGNTFNKLTTDSSLYFNLPDLRSIFIRGHDATNGQRIFGSMQPCQTALPKNTQFRTNVGGNHTHTLTSAGDHQHTTSFNTTSFNGANDVRTLTVPNYNGVLTYPTNVAGAHIHSMDAQGAHSHIVDTGGDSETCPYNITLNYIIRVK